MPVLVALAPTLTNTRASAQHRYQAPSLLLSTPCPYRCLWGVMQASPPLRDSRRRMPVNTPVYKT